MYHRIQRLGAGLVVVAIVVCQFAITEISYTAVLGNTEESTTRQSLTQETDRADGISLDTVIGLNEHGNIVPGEDIQFVFRLANTTADALMTFNFGFEVYSPDDAIWEPITLDTLSINWADYYGIGVLINYFSANGSGADTAYIAAIGMPGGGFPPGFDEQVWSITTQVNAEDVGRQLCVDSSWFPPAGDWLWCNESGCTAPNWDGPHCFTIADSVPVDSLIIPSVPELLVCDGQPVQVKLTQPIAGATIPIEMPAETRICSLSTEGLVTESWDMVYVTVSQDYASIGFTNTLGLTIDPGVTTVCRVFYERACTTDVAVSPLDTALSDNPSLQLKFADPEGTVIHPGFAVADDPTGVLGYLPGDVDGNGSGPDIADLVYLATYMFQEGSPPCVMDATDVNGDCGGPDIGDLVYLVCHMFQECPPPACGCISSGVAAKPRFDTDVRVSVVYENGTTTVTTASPTDLLGLQLELHGDRNTEPVPMHADEIEMLHGVMDGRIKLGILDMEGVYAIEAGENVLVEIPGYWEIVWALAVDRSMQTVIPNVSRFKSTLPTRFSLGHNYPNPFNPTTEISFGLPQASDVRLDILNVLGQKVTTVVNGHLEAGEHTYQWDGSDMASGMYFYRLSTPEFTESKKMILLK